MHPPGHTGHFGYVNMVHVIGLSFRKRTFVGRGVRIGEIFSQIGKTHSQAPPISVDDQVCERSSRARGPLQQASVRHRGPFKEVNFIHIHTGGMDKGIVNYIHNAPVTGISVMEKR